MENGKDKRRYERIKIGSDKIYDLSEGGMFIRTTEPKRLGAVIALEIKLFENQTPVRVKARVLRIVYEKGASKQFPPGMAVEFLDLSEENRERIRVYIKTKKKQASL